MKQIHPSARPRRALLYGVLLLSMLLSLLAPAGVVLAQSGNAGYRDFQFPAGTGGATRGPTGEKPESKLWWVDGSWYGVLWSSANSAFTIHRFNLAGQAWVNTGVAADDRLGSKADVLWDGSKLYIASHLYVENAATAAPAGQRAELFRYSYNPATKTFALDGGFPVEINGAITETLVIDKDANGTLWITYVQDAKVMVNHSLGGNDAAWGTPFVLPAGGMEVVHTDDISSLIVYNNHVGVMWSRQKAPYTMYFSVHPINAPDSTWTRVRSYTVSADDHINLKSLESDSAGNVFAVIKTNNNSALIVLLVCKNNLNRCKSESDWTPYTVYNTDSGSPTRPMLLIDESNREIYVFARVEPTGTTQGGIYYKKTSLDAPSFNASSIGTVFINNPTDFQVDDPTSTKQNLTSTTGLLLLASDRHSRYYLHNYIALGGTPPGPPTISGFSPTSGPAGTQVTISGSNFNGVNSVTLNGSAASFTVNSAAQITASVPAGATSGKFGVSSPAGSALSSGTFTVTAAPTYSLTVSTQGSGSVALSPPGGVYDQGSIVTLTATAPEGWLFSGWQGDLSGSANPAQLTMNSNKNVTAVFTQQSSGGSVAHEQSVTGTAVSTASVSSAAIGGSGLFLAAISSRNPATVSSVSGLGLTWTRVLRQCAARNITMLEVWMAQGSASSGAVTASFPAAFKSAAITVSRYGGASTVQPLGAQAAGNTLGLNGACSGGTDSSAYNFSLNSAGAGGMLYSAVAIRNRLHTPGAGYTERAEIAAGTSSDMSTVAVQDRALSAAGAVTVNGSLSGAVDWAWIGLELRPGSGTPPAEPTISGFSPTSGPVGTQVTVSGANLSGASSVTFNGTAASFTVNSAAQISASVPAGATDGPIAVTTPGGSASSAASFDVTTPPPAEPTISGFSPSSGPVGAQVTISGSNFSGASAVTFNGTSASFTVNSAAQITASVPAGASDGPISVTTPGGSATSAGSFSVTSAPASYTLAVTPQGSGSVALSPAGGVYSAGTLVTLTAQPAAGWLFSGWQGDLSGSANPAQLTMDSNKSVTAIFTQQSGGGGSVAHEQTVSGGALAASAVNSPAIGGSGLFLAAVASRNTATVSSVSGLGLTWTRVTRQCAGRNNTMIEIWAAQGAAATGAVTANFPATFKSAVISVSRYSGAGGLGAPLAGNTLGLNGACSGGADSAAYSFNLNATTPGALVYSTVALRNRAHTPGAGYTERGEVLVGSGGDVAGLAVSDAPVGAAGALTVNGTLSGVVDWAWAGLEILPAP